ncbi:MAG TPA: DNA mismatch repair endonuclease MutL [bacterium]|nr:DNA mismatch repair endonuclease MutL [bacterium]
MASIHLLSDLMMKRIAAGEVVERPASVAKELIENALDAGSSRILLRIEESGVSLIEVTDDGNGMTEEDVLLCCRRHATSKIRDEEDLEAITTLGFRGEALASISAVSRMVITTCHQSENEGTQVLLESGEIREVLKVAPRKGTTVSVRDLFAAVPARRKFLKTPVTELRHLIRVFRTMVLSHPKIDWTLQVNGDKTMHLLRNTLEERLNDVLGDSRELIHIHRSVSGLNIEAWISRPGDGRKSRENQFVFINGRAVQNRSLSHAVLSAYGNRLGRGEYPVYILYIEMDPRLVDVNVHPMKSEVRFQDEHLIYNLIRKITEDALRGPAVIPDLHLITKKRGSNLRFRGNETPRLSSQLSLEAQSTETAPLPASVSFREGEKRFPELWQIHNRYILSQIKSGITIIDQHVAHERILYEKVLACKKSAPGGSQQLLFPQTLQLSIDDYSTLTEINTALERIGFGLKEFGKQTVVIESVPLDIRKGNEKDILLDILDDYRENRGTGEDFWDAVAKSYACKSAVKSGDSLTLPEMTSLIDQLFATSEPYFCPHGRPIIVNLSLEEIDRRFGR